MLQVIQKGYHRVSKLFEPKTAGNSGKRQIVPPQARTGYICAYLLVGGIDMLRGRQRWQRSVERLFVDPQRYILPSALFLSQHEAAEYCRFVSQDRAIVCVIVPEHAIESDQAGLRIKKPFLITANIYACFSGDGKYYQPNPNFVIDRLESA